MGDSGPESASDRTRRDFLKMAGVAGAAATTFAATAKAGGGGGSTRGVPSYLSDYADLYRQNPRKAALKWLSEAKYGLFLHFGLYSLLGRGEWVMFREQIRPADYATLQDSFTAEDFDAEAICRLAREAGMEYVNITTKHHDSFCLWDTDETGFKTTKAPCGRDLIGELAEACEKHGLGLCLYYSHGRDWKHPHAPNRENYNRSARPHYDPPEPTYARGAAHDLQYYNDYCFNQIDELLSSYGSIAAIWLDGVSTPESGDLEPFRLQELYDEIHAAQPQVLISYKSGLTGTEDFYAPEHGWDLQKKRDIPAEVCASMHDRWGHVGGSERMGPDEVWNLLTKTLKADCNLLLNTGPLPDGSIHPDDAETLRRVGERIRKKGFPA